MIAESSKSGRLLRLTSNFIIVVLVAASIAGRLSAQEAQLKVPDRVLVNYDGTWYPGSIYVAHDGKYKVLRDNYMSDDRWVTIEQLKRAPKVDPVTPAVVGLPGSVPRGMYTCGTLLSGAVSGSAMGTTIGQLRVVGDGVYESLVKEGAGTRANFAYNAGTGKIEWEGGRLAGFFGKVTASRLSLDNRGKPVIQVTYRVREGGNLFDLSCSRDQK